MKRSAAKDVRLLTDVRDRLLAKISELDRVTPPRYPSGRLAPYRPARTSGTSISAPIDCTHGVPWTACTTCSKPR